MNELVKYLLGTLGTPERTKTLADGGLYIWNAAETKILAGPFETMQHALDFKSAALDKAIAIYNRGK